MSGLTQDLHNAFRALKRSPAATTAAVLMLALGIGSATAIFSIVESILIRPLPWPESERIMALWEVTGSGRRIAVSTANYLDWRSQSRTLEHMTALNGFPSTIAGNGRSARGSVSGSYGDVLEVFGLRVEHGRAFSADDKQNGGVAVIRNGLAKDLWDDPAKAVGQKIDAAGTPLTVIGVLEEFREARTDVYVPAATFGPDDSTRTAHNWRVLARLAPGSTLLQAQTEMRTIGERMFRQYGSETNAASVGVASLLENSVRDIRPALLALMAAGGLLILIACANVANLLLAQGVARRREIAIRLTLGASRGRIIRQLLVESATLGLIAGAAGALLAQWSFSGLLNMIPGNLPRMSEISMDSAALAFAILSALAASLLFGIAPALSAGRPLALSLKEQGRTSTGGDTLLRKAFVIGEFAIALAMLICAGLLVKSFVRLLEVDPGFRYEQVLVAETELPAVEYTGDAALVAFWRPMLERLSSLADVDQVGLVSSEPLEGFHPDGSFMFVDEPGREGYATYAVASSGYFKTLEVPLVRGRLFDDSDTLTAPHAIVINETAAKKFWPDQDPIGKRIAWYGMDVYGQAPLTVVGVVGDARDESLKDEANPEFFLNFFQRPNRARDMDLVVRARSDVATLPGLLRSEFKSADPSLPVRFHSLGSVLDNARAQPRFQMMLFGYFAVCAVLLSAIGLFSAVAYMVTRQTREIGIRLALGASPQSVRRYVLRNGMSMTLLGIAIGVVLALGGGRLIATFLYGVEQSDVSVFVIAAGLLAAAALLACYLPARRASRVDPMQALRYE